MGIIISILVVGLIIYLISGASKKASTTEPTYQSTIETEFPPEINEVSSHMPDEDEEEKFPPVRQINEGTWVLNPEAPFELTVLSEDQKLVQEIRELLEDNRIRYFRKEARLIALFTTHQIRIKEIEEYKKKYKNQYLEKIEELKSNSLEWAAATENDKVDLLIEFRDAALALIYERAKCDLQILFEIEPKKISLPNGLIAAYGFENIQTYLRYALNPDKIHVIDRHHFSHPIFLKLEDQGLAERNTGLQEDEILNILPIRDLNAIALNPEKKYRRKREAVEFIMAHREVKERIGKYLSTRTLFRLKRLPEKFNPSSLREVAETWNYHSQEVRLLVDTFRNSFYAWSDLKDDEYVKGYRVEPFDKEFSCPCAIAVEKKRFSKDNPPRVPFHIGCNCLLNKEYSL